MIYQDSPSLCHLKERRCSLTEIVLYQRAFAWWNFLKLCSEFLVNTFYLLQYMIILWLPIALMLIILPRMNDFKLSISWLLAKCKNKIKSNETQKNVNLSSSKGEILGQSTTGLEQRAETL